MHMPGQNIEESVAPTDLPEAPLESRLGYLLKLFPDGKILRSCNIERYSLVTIGKLLV